MKLHFASSQMNPAAAMALRKTYSAPVLLVEDDEPLRHLLEIVLERAGYQVVAVGDGLEAMKILLSQPVQAVVTDAIMPFLNGHELCRFLRRHPKLAHLPLIMLSGLTENRPMLEVNESPDVYLAKPVRSEELLDSLAGLLTACAV